MGQLQAKSSTDADGNVPDSPLIGLRVVRGLDWKPERGNDDGGEGHVGTIVSVRRSKAGEEAEVVWDIGTSGHYRCSDEYDLCIFDNAPKEVRHLNVSCKECNAANIAGMRWTCTVCSELDLCTKCYMADLHDTAHVFARCLTPGASQVVLPPRKDSSRIEALGLFRDATVIRSRDWCWDAQDGGKCDDSSNVGTVVGLSDFGDKGVRDAVLVSWSVKPEQERLYRVGHKGKVDLKCLPDGSGWRCGSGGRYYAAHLPLAGAEDASPFKIGDLVECTPGDGATASSKKAEDDSGRVGVDAPQQTMTKPSEQGDKLVGVVRRIRDGGKLEVELYRPSETRQQEFLSKNLIKIVRYKVGNRVKIDSDEGKVKTCQKTHWVPSMVKVLGKIGKVTEVFDDGELGVDVQGRFLVLTPLVCSLAHDDEDGAGTTEDIEPKPSQPVPSFAERDIVTVIRDIDLAKPLQKGHGGWNDDMAESLGKTGKVVRVHQNGDIRVKVNKKCWTFNPKCLIVPSEADREAYERREVSGSSSSSSSDSGISGLRGGQARVRVKVRAKATSQRWQRAVPFSAGDIVTVLSDLARLKELQSGDDCTRSDLEEILGKTGKIKRSLPSGNLKVTTAGSRTWILNPKCVQLSRNSGKENARYAKDLLPSPAELLFDSDAALIKAVLLGKPSRVQKILATDGSKVNAKFNGITPLSVATIAGKLDAMKLLLDAGANVTLMDDDESNTALHHAAKTGNSDAVGLLLPYYKALPDQRNKSQQTALHSAAGAIVENSAVVNQLLERGCDPNTKDCDGYTALHCAISKNNYDAIELLVDGSADLQLQNNLGFNALHMAVLNESICAVKAIMAKISKSSSSSGVDLVNATTGGNGLTALHLAAARGSLSIADVLLHQVNVNKDARDCHGDTPLLLAARHGHVEVARLLVKRGADVTAKDQKGNTCLHLEMNRHRLLCGRSSASCLAQNFIFTVCPAISEANIIKIKNNAEETALDIDACEPARRLLQSASIDAAAATTRSSIDAKIDSGAAYPTSSSAATAASAGDGGQSADEALSRDFAEGDLVQVVSDSATLQEKQRGHGGWNSVMQLAAGQTGKVMWLFPSGDLRVHVDGQNWTLNPACCLKLPSPPSDSRAAECDDGNSSDSSNSSRSGGTSRPASTADSESDSDGDLVQLVTRGKLSALQAKIRRRPKEKLNARVGSVAPLHVAAGRGNVDAAKMLLDAGADINVCDVDNDRPLHHAAVRGQPSMIRLLLQRGAQLDCENKQGHTALHYASGASSQDVSCVTALLDHKNSDSIVNLRDFDGDTALHCAIAKNHQAIIAKLVDHPRTDLNLRNHLGFNALHSATFRGDDTTVRKIINSRARDLINAKSNSGLTALHMAATYGHRAVTDLLLKAKADTEIVTEHCSKQTALLLAVAHGHKEIVELLLNGGAAVTARDDSGRTCLHVALRRHQLLYGVSSAPALPAAAGTAPLQLLQLLQDLGGDWTWIDDNGRRAADIAESLGIRLNRDQDKRLLLLKPLPPAPDTLPTASGAGPTGTLASHVAASSTADASPGQASTTEQQQQQPETSVEADAVSSSTVPRGYQSGDVVRILKDRDVVKKRQKGHGGWNDNMTSALGCAGSVLAVDSDGDVRVRVGGRRWVFNPRCLEPASDAEKADIEQERLLVSELREGAVVRVIADASKVRELQIGHGGWNEMMETVLDKVGVVTEVDSDGDVRVRVGGRRWTFNPLCLKLVDDPKEREAALQEQSPPFKAGDVVKIIDDCEKAQKLQKGHGGWNDSMASALGQIGTVVEIDRDDDVRVRVNKRRWVFNPACLTIASEEDKSKLSKDAEQAHASPFKPGDQVKLITDADKVQELQKGHGGWTRGMKRALGKVGRVIDIDSNDDVRVRIHGHTWALNPQCLVVATDADKEPSDGQPGGSDHSSSSSSSDELAALLKSLKKRMVSDDSDDEPRKPASGGSSKFGIGDMVTVSKDLSKVRDLQDGHGEWVSEMEKILGQTGKVNNIFPSGDLRVRFRNRAFTLNPECCTAATEAERAAAAKLKGDTSDSSSSSSSDGIMSAMRGESESKLVQAVAHGTPAEVKKILLKSKAKVNSKVAGLAPLHVAAGKGVVESVLLLLEAGADVELTDKDGDTPLHHAALSGETDAVHALLDRDAPPNVRNKRGLTPLHYAVVAVTKGDRAEQSSHVLPDVLLKACDVNIQDIEGDTALHVAVSRDCPEVIDQLLACPKIDVRVKNNMGWSALHVAVRQGNDGAVEQIVTKADGVVNDLSGHKLSALHMAAMFGRVEAAKILLEKGGADVKLLDGGSGKTALLLAAAHCHKEVVDLLLAKCTDPAERRENASQCLEVALVKHRLLYGDALPAESSPLIRFLQQMASLPDAADPGTGPTCLA